MITETLTFALKTNVTSTLITIKYQTIKLHLAKPFLFTTNSAYKHKKLELNKSSFSPKKVYGAKKFYFERIIITGPALKIKKKNVRAVIGTLRDGVCFRSDGITFQSKRKIGACMFAINLMTRSWFSVYFWVHVSFENLIQIWLLFTPANVEHLRQWRELTPNQFGSFPKDLFWVNKLNFVFTNSIF